VGAAFSVGRLPMRRRDARKLWYWRGCFADGGQVGSFGWGLGATLRLDVFVDRKGIVMT
jgi:hypothetical protein